MKTKRKPKGEEGSTIQLRDLDAETLETIRRLREHFNVGTNSKAVLLAVKHFIPYMDEITDIRDQLQTIRETDIARRQVCNNLQAPLIEVNRLAGILRSSYDHAG